ncbi:AAA family ATPase [Halosquirtibacter xylanolyticus]|uniref:AAA family ATPase n=1 Tax=Halosquirtibacter xylanolyticus TaxID=3374599 RepID=UPI003747E4FD|nr:AAA family ATPase [Prolixibacteraceae bacterium]
MRIAYIEVQNFRKLKSCRIELSEKETILVGANNSGKTSAMDVLMLFLKKTKRTCFSPTDITLSNWIQVNEIEKNWLSQPLNEDALSIKKWESIVPSIDIWLDVTEDEVHYVSNLIPTLSWNGGKLGVRMRFEPKDIESLFNEFKSTIDKSQHIVSSEKNKKHKVELWPKSLKDFLEKKFHNHFGVKSYILNPELLKEPNEGKAIPQELPDEAIPLEKEPFEGLFKIDVINAQRGFSDANTTDSPTNSSVSSLTNQLRSYYDKHLNPTENPNPEDIEALAAIDEARRQFDTKLKKSFGPAISELEELGYPGFSDPEIIISSKVKPTDGLDHESAVQFNVFKTENNEDIPSYLPEKYNGLGYQNLVSMVFKLIRFRDEWLKKGKAKSNDTKTDDVVEPLHLVLIEEPEAHLHAQVQQVFIKKAYSVLRKHAELGDNTKLSTQMIVSTHSSHIAHEIDFTSLRYFKRLPASKEVKVPCATIVNLSTTFGSEDKTSKFATRYLKTTHSDIFFADAVILVEGSVENMLLPHFIKHKFSKLHCRYITVLEIGGSHAKQLQPLINDLGIITLVVTDIDSIKESSNEKVLPYKGKNYRTGNSTLKEWLPREQNFDKLIDLKVEDKTSENNLVRVAYQFPFKIEYKGNPDTLITPYTFEDALVFSNIKLFEKLISPSGLIKKMVEALKKEDVIEACTDMFEALKTGKKAEMALELLYLEDPKKLETPLYIKEGLDWLNEKLSQGSTSTKGGVE